MAELAGRAWQVLNAQTSAESTLTPRKPRLLETRSLTASAAPGERGYRRPDR